MTIPQASAPCFGFQQAMPNCHTLSMTPPATISSHAIHTMAAMPMASLNNVPAYQLTIIPQRGSFTSNQPTPVWLQLRSITTGQGPASLNIVHEKPIHAFLISQDWQEFDHLHPVPVQGRPDLFQAQLNLTRPVPYRLFTQFQTPQENDQTASAAIGLGQALPTSRVDDSHWVKRSGAYDFQVRDLPTRNQPERHFVVDVFKQGQPVTTLQPLLGAAGHAMIVNDNTDTLIHTHPMNDTLSSPLRFHTTITQPGFYKLWVQTQLDNQIHTVNWTFQI